MNYQFDEVVDRAHDPYSFSGKWGNWAARSLGLDKLPDDAICLQTADMDFKAAPEIIEDLKKVAEHGIFGYSMMDDRYTDAVRGWFHDRFGWDFPAEDIVYTAGTHTAVAECVKRLTNPGEGVIVTTPCYSYHGDIEPNGRVFVGVPMLKDEENYYTVDYDAFEKACAVPENTMFVLCHPHNPSGRVFTPEELTRMTEICRKHGVIVVSDEVHCDIVRKGVEFHPLMEVVGPEGVVGCTAVNKTFNLAGLAMSNMVISDPVLKERFGRFFSLPSPFGIQAVISAYTKGGPWVEALNEYLDESLDYVVSFFHEKMPKVKVRMPEGTYILWLDFSGYGLSDEDLEQKFKDQHMVMSFGRGFDVENGGQWLRMCLPSAHSVIREACSRILKAFEG